jgi:hypothetical protein
VFGLFDFPLFFLLLLCWIFTEEKLTKLTVPRGIEQNNAGRAFCVVPLAKLLVFGVLGSWLYLFYWTYRNWSVYRAADGYSRQAFWRSVRQKTGYRPSPFWRAFFGAGYCFCLFPAIHRECLVGGVQGLRAPIFVAAVYSIVGGLGPSCCRRWRCRC